jgi:Skp family chaperone for outer membrane proteins
MKTVFLSAIPAALALAFVAYSAEGQTTPASPTQGIAYVSSNRLLSEVASARTQLARIQVLQQQKNTELRAKQQEIESTRQQFASAADAESRNRLLKQEQEQRSELERAMQQAQADVQKLQREVQAEVQGEVRKTIQQIVLEQNIKLVLNADTAIVWSAPGIDITSQVVDRMNAATVAAKP